VIPAQFDVIKNPVKTGFFIFIFFFFIIGCEFNRNKISTQIVVQVNNKTMTTKEFADKLARQIKNLDALTAKDPVHFQRIKEEIIRNFLIGALTSEFSEVQKITVTDSEVEKAANEVRSGYPDDIAFRKVLAQENVSLNQWKSDLKQQLVDKKVFNLISGKIQSPNEVEIKKFYQDNKERYRRKERIYLLQIVVDELSKAQAIKEDLGKKSNFSDLAKKFSISPEAKMGGRVGWVEKGSVDIFDKAFLLPVGGTSQVLESVYGFHIFRVERRAAAGYANLEEVREEIVRLLLAQKEQAEFMGWLDRQIRQARILKNQGLINSISVETRGKN